MKIIIITTEAEYPNEAERISEFIEQGIYLLHIRKPLWSETQMENLIREIPTQFHHKLVIHSHFKLCSKYNLHGIHLGKNRMEIPANHKGSISYSCHSIDELKTYKHLDYCTISPIFDSISKAGYSSQFSMEELSNAVKNRTIDNNTFALGGVSFDNIKILEQIGFSGACLLGAAWNI